MKHLLSPLLFLSCCTMITTAAPLRSAHVPLNGGRQVKEKPAKAIEIPPSVNEGDIITTPRDVYVFTASEDAKVFAGMVEQNKEDADTWAGAKERQNKAGLIPKGSKLVVKKVQRKYVPGNTPQYETIGNGSGYERINAVARAQHEAEVRNSDLNAVLTVETLEGKKGYIVRKLMLSSDKKKKKH